MAPAAGKCGAFARLLSPKDVEKVRRGLKSQANGFGTPGTCGGFNWYCGVYVMRTQTPLARASQTSRFILC